MNFNEVQRVYCEGMKLNGCVKHIFPFGVFLDFEDANVVGLVEVTELAQHNVNTSDNPLKIGDILFVEVLGCLQGNPIQIICSPVR